MSLNKIDSLTSSQFYLNNKYKEIKDPVINEGPVIDKKIEEEKETNDIDWDF